MASETLRAESARVTPARPLPPLGDLSINGVKPFWSHPDGRSDRLDEAHAILTLFADRLDMVEAAQGDVDGGDIRCEIRAQALRGVATLIALALYHGDCADSRETA